MSPDAASRAVTPSGSPQPTRMTAPARAVIPGAPVRAVRRLYCVAGCAGVPSPGAPVRRRRLCVPSRLAGGALQVLSARDIYGAAGPVDPERVVTYLAAATEQALAHGFRGLAVSGDATELVRASAHRDAFARSEFLLDCYMTTHPLSAL